MVDPKGNPYSLTASDVDQLRGSIRWRTSNGSVPYIDGEAANQTPAILWDHQPPSLGKWVLWLGPRKMASGSLEQLGACLRCEAIEPGFILRILDPAEPPDLASLRPDLAARERARANAERAKARLAQEAAEAASARRMAVQHVDLASLSLDDLLD